MKVAILGAGAIGLPLGYMFRNRERNEVVYLVRESKVDQLKEKTFKLFSYDKKRIIEYSGLQALPTEPLIDGNSSDENPYADFDLVVVTLPTDVLESVTGIAIITGLAKLAKKECVFLSLSPGFQVQEKVFTPSGVDKSRVAFGLPLFLSHEVDKSPHLDNKRYPLMAECDFAFHYLVKRWPSSRLLLSRRPKPLKRSMKVAGMGSISVGTSTLEASTALFLILNMLLMLQDFPKSLKKKHPSFNAAMGAFNQIMKQYGGVGRTMRLSVGKNMMKITDKSNRLMSKPLTTEFLKYHHGYKVKEQNIEVIEAYIVSGQAKKLKTDKIEAFAKMCRDFEPVVEK